MNTISSSSQLSEILQHIKTAITHFEENHSENIIYLNDTAMFQCFSALPCGDSTIEDCLKQISDYIPLAISDKALELFLFATEADLPKNQEKYISAFEKQCQLDFIKLIKKSNNQTDWDHLVNACQKLYQNKTKSQLSYV